MGPETTATRGSRLHAWIRPRVPSVVGFAACAAAAMLIAAPVALERAVQGVQFSDRLGTFPVNVSLCRDGRSTLDTGLFGKVYWDQAGAYGFGVHAQASGPPESGGTLASYVDPEFVQTNVELINDPDAVVRAYSAKFADGLRKRLIRDELLAGIVGGTILFLIVPRRRLQRQPTGPTLAVIVLLVAGATAVSAAAAVQLFRAWPCSDRTGLAYPMPGVAQLSFGSPETLEVARQVQPLIDKNLDRSRADARRYQAAARTSLADQLDELETELTPRADETVVAAEADPQGSFVGARVRTGLYAKLRDLLGPKAISLRTISGDVSSNGTVAEADFIARESQVSPRIPTVATAGDHDSKTTWQQMTDNGMVVPDLDTTKVGGLRVSAVNDREHKSLFGGLVTNPTGISEQELGGRLRTEVTNGPRIVLLHQPDAAAGYLGLPSLAKVRALDGSATIPYDDGIPDQPAGTINIGHLHDADGPWVLWNTDTDRITWTVVDQLGTSGGVENRPTFNRFSTPTSVPLKPLTVRLQFVHTESGLQTGFATIRCGLDGQCTVSERTDVGLPDGQPRDSDDPRPNPDRHFLDPTNWPFGSAE